MKGTILALMAASVQSTGLQVFHPESLREKFGPDGVIQSHLGSKGHINYGHSFVSTVYYPKNNRNACSPFVNSDFGDVNKEKSSVLIDHGGCSHVEKAKNAETFGFQAAIIIDDDAYDYYTLRNSKGSNKLERIGYDLKIPYFKIFGSSGSEIIKKLTSNVSPVKIKIDLSLMAPDNRVEYELWYSSILDITPSQIQ